MHVILLYYNNYYHACEEFNKINNVKGNILETLLSYSDICDLF